MLSVYAHAGFVYEFVLSEFAVKRAQLELVQLEGEPWAHFLEVCSRAIGEELVAVVSEEYEVSLVVESHDLPPVEVRVLREQCCQHATYSLAGHSIEVIHYQFRWVIMTCGSSMIRNVLIQLHAANSECSSGPLGQVRNYQ